MQAPRGQGTESPSLSLVPLPLLQDSASYTAGTFNLDGAYKTGKGCVTYEQWIDVFRRSIDDFQKRAAADESVSDAVQKAESFAKAYNRILDDILSRDKRRREPGSKPDVQVPELCSLREQCLRSAGFTDVFAAVKRAENEKALQLLPAVLRDLDEIRVSSKAPGDAAESGGPSQEESLWTQVLRGVFAGNIFDLGATASAKLFEEGGLSFLSTRRSLAARRCAIDDFAAAVKRLTIHRYSKAILFVDNAGSDVVLGMLPFARELLIKGTAVVIAANSIPAINDVTAEEVQRIIEKAGQLDMIFGRALLERSLVAVGSGNDLPVIELNKVSSELASAAENADLVVLEGMGRGIETNLDADLTVDKLNLGMIKHPEVARLLDCEVYNCICKFTPAPGS